MTLRRIATFDQPISPFAGGKAGGKDPRGFVSGNVPGQAWDIEQFATDRVSLRDFPPQQYSQVHHTSAQMPPDAAVRTIPARVNYIRWAGTTPVSGKPMLLVPRNPRRLEIVLGNTATGNNLRYSWGPPLNDETFGRPIGFEITIGSSGTPLRFAGAVPLNDLFLFSDFGAIDVLAYEAIAAPEGNII